MRAPGLLILLVLTLISCSTPNSTTAVNPQITVQGDENVLINNPLTYTVDFQDIRNPRVLWFLDDTVIAVGVKRIEIRVYSVGRHVVRVQLVDRLTQFEIASSAKVLNAGTAILRIAPDSAEVEQFQTRTFSITWLPQRPSEPYFVRWQLDTMRVTEFDCDTCPLIAYKPGSTVVIANAYDRRGKALCSSTAFLTVLPLQLNIVGDSEVRSDSTIHCDARVMLTSRLHLVWDPGDGGGLVRDVQHFTHKYALPGGYEIKASVLSLKDTVAIARKLVVFPSTITSLDPNVLQHCNQVNFELEGELQWSGVGGSNALFVRVDSLLWSGSEAYRKVHLSDSTVEYPLRTSIDKQDSVRFRVLPFQLLSSLSIDTTLSTTTVNSVTKMKSYAPIHFGVRVQNIPLLEWTRDSVVYGAIGSRLQQLITTDIAENRWDKTSQRTLYLQGLNWQSPTSPPRLRIVFYRTP